MKTKVKMRFFILVNKTLEFSEIKSFLSKHRYIAENIKEVNEDFISKLQALEETLEIFLIGFAKNGLFPPRCSYINKTASKSVYENLLRYLHLQPDDWQKLIILNQNEGMKGLYKSCVRKEEVDQILSKEYARLGITKKDLEIMETDFESEKIENGLYSVTVEKERFKRVVLDRAVRLSRGLTMFLDVWVKFRDGSPSYYLGNGHVAYCLFDKFQGLYDGNEDWTGYNENLSEVAEFLRKHYADKRIAAQELKASYAAANAGFAKEVSKDGEFKVKKGKKK